MLSAIANDAKVLRGGHSNAPILKWAELHAVALKGRLEHHVYGKELSVPLGTGAQIRADTNCPDASSLPASSVLDSKSQSSFDLAHGGLLQVPQRSNHRANTVQVALLYLPSSKKASGDNTSEIIGSCTHLLSESSSQQHAGAGSAWSWLLLHFRQAMPPPTPFEMAAQQLQEL